MKTAIILVDIALFFLLESASDRPALKQFSHVWTVTCFAAVSAPYSSTLNLNVVSFSFNSSFKPSSGFRFPQSFYTKSIFRTILQDNDRKQTVKAPTELFNGQQWNVIDEAGQSSDSVQIIMCFTE